MTIFPLILDIIFYNYTNYATCFFLLIFLRKDLTFFNIFLLGLIWDILILHTWGLFTLILIIIYILSRRIKGINLNPLRYIFRYLLISLGYFILSFIIFNIDFSIYFYGLLFNVAIIIFSTMIYHFFI